MPSKIMHVVFFKFPDVDEAGERKLVEVLLKFDELEGIECAFSNFITPFADYTHILMIVAADQACLKAYLHSDAHLKDWMGASKPYLKGIIVFDCALTEDVGPFGSISLLKLSGDDARYVEKNLNGKPHLGAEFLTAVAWPDKSEGFTHCVTVSFPHRDLLSAHIASDERKAIFDLVAHTDDGMVTCNCELGTVFKANF